MTELIKLRRAKITWVSLIAISILPLMAGLFVWMVKEPDRASQFGLLGTKTQIVGMSPDWPGFLMLILQAMGVAGMILVAVLAAYVFGREYTEGTAKILLALSIGRHWFVVNKLGVVALWFFVLVAALVTEALFVGWALDIPGFTTDLAISTVTDLFLAALVSWLVVPVPVLAWIAALGRGYLAPLGFTMFMLLLGNVLGATGWGKWFPWSIVPMFSGVAGPRVETLTPVSISILVATFFAGTLGTIWQLRHADNVQ